MTRENASGLGTVGRGLGAQRRALAAASAVLFLALPAARGQLLRWRIEHESLSLGKQVSESLTIRVRGDYGAVTQAMTWDTKGRVTGGYTRTDRKNAAVGEPHVLTVEKRGAKASDWQVVSTRTVKDGGSATQRFTFDEVGTYRIKAELTGGTPPCFPLGPVYSATFDVARKQDWTSGLLRYRLERPSFAKPKWTGEAIPIRVVGDYGVITQPMTWNSYGRITGGMTRVDRKDVPVGESHTITVERGDENGKNWKTFATRQVATGTRDPELFAFKEQGLYRFRASLDAGAKPAFPLGPITSPILEIHDRKHERSEAITGVSIELPVGFAGTGISLQASRHGCGSRSFRCFASRTKLSAESRWGFVGRAESKRQLYRKPRWVLKAMGWQGKSYVGKVLIEKSGPEHFTFDCKYWGDGQYQLEAHLDSIDQGQGLQNYQVRPAVASIHLTGCGDGSLPEAQRQIKQQARSGAAGGRSQVKNWAQAPVVVNKKNQAGELVPHNLKPGDVIKPAPPPPPVRPCDNRADCPVLFSQIAHREKQLAVSCEPPTKLMEAIAYDIPEKYFKLEADRKKWLEQAKVIVAAEQKKLDQAFKQIEQKWAAFKKECREVPVPYKGFGGGTRYKKVSVLLEDRVSGLLAKLPKERRSSLIQLKASDGGPPRIGDGLPYGMFEFGPEMNNKIAALKTKQKQLLDEWAAVNAQRKADAKKALEQRIAKATVGVKDNLERQRRIARMPPGPFGKVTGLRDALGMAQDELDALVKTHDKTKKDLAGMFYAGTHEHCLGMPAEISGTGDAVVFIDPKGKATMKGSLHTGLPGMNVILGPVAKLDKLPELKLTRKAPEPLKFVPDGRKQLARDCEYLSGIFKRLKTRLHRTNGTWGRAALNVMRPLGKALGADVLAPSLYVDPPPKGTWTDVMDKRYRGTGEAVLAAVGDLSTSIAESIWNPLGHKKSSLHEEVRKQKGDPFYNENMALRKTLYAAWKAAGDGVVKKIREWETKVADIDENVCASFKEAVDKGDPVAVRRVLGEMAKMSEAIRMLNIKLKGAEATPQVMLDILASLGPKLLRIKVPKALLNTATGQRILAMQNRIRKLDQAAYRKNLQKAHEQARKRTKVIAEGARREAQMQNRMARLKQRLEKGRITNKAYRSQYRKLFGELQKVKTELDKLTGRTEILKRQQTVMMNQAFERYRRRNKPKSSYGEIPLKGEDARTFTLLSDKGGTARVMRGTINGRTCVLKEFRKGQEGGLQREIAGAKLLDGAGLEYARIRGTARAPGGPPMLVKEYIGPGGRVNGMMLDDFLAKNNHVLPKGVRDAVVDYTRRANKRGLILTDFKPGNIYVYKVGNRYRIGLIEADGVVRVTNATAALNDLRDSVIAFRKSSDLAPFTGLPKVTAKALADPEQARKIAAQYQHFQMFNEHTQVNFAAGRGLIGTNAPWVVKDRNYGKAFTSAQNAQIRDIKPTPRELAREAFFQASFMKNAASFLLPSQVKAWNSLVKELSEMTARMVALQATRDKLHEQVKKLEAEEKKQQESQSKQQASLAPVHCGHLAAAA